jgi:FlaG/FlaF family flagellin (archaellin)
MRNSSRATVEGIGFLFRALQSTGDEVTKYANLADHHAKVAIAATRNKEQLEAQLQQERDKHEQQISDLHAQYKKQLEQQKTTVKGWLDDQRQVLEAMSAVDDQKSLPETK